MRGITYAIGSEQVALTYRRMPQHTGSKGSYGHRHKTQEELYFVISGKLQFKLEDWQSTTRHFHSSDGIHRGLGGNPVAPAHEKHLDQFSRLAEIDQPAL